MKIFKFPDYFMQQLFIVLTILALFYTIIS